MTLRKKLSPSLVDGAKPAAAPFRIWDTTVPALFLRVQPSGVKSWNVQWSRTSSRSLGKWPAVTVAAARERARAVLVETDQHGKPLAVLEHGKGGVRMFGDYITKEYEPWAVANRKDGAATVARLQSTFKDFLGKPLADVTPWIVEKWRSKRLKADIAPTTVNRDLAALKACLAMAVMGEFLDAHPLEKVKPSKVDTHGRVRYLSDDEEKNLRVALRNRDDAARASRKHGNAWRAERDYELLPTIPAHGFADHLTPMVLLAMNTGMRRGELTSLTWDDINLAGKSLTVRGSNAKSGKTRHIPLNAEALDVLKRYQRQHAEGRLFDLTRVNKSFTAITEKAGIQNFRFHDLRHTFASKLVMAGADLYVVKDLLGHASIAMTERYAHLAPARKAAAVALLKVAK